MNPTSAKNSLNTRTAGERRGRRVVALVGLALVLGMADLVLTLYFMNTMGMVEANPLARMLAAHGAGALVAFKLVTMVMNAGGLMLFRTRHSAEFGAWITAAIMVSLAVHWHGFVAEHASMAPWEHEFMAANAEFVCLAHCR